MRDVQGGRLLLEGRGMNAGKKEVCLIYNAILAHSPFIFFPGIPEQSERESLWLADHQHTVILTDSASLIKNPLAPMIIVCG